MAASADVGWTGGSEKRTDLKVKASQKPRREMKKVWSTSICTGGLCPIRIQARSMTGTRNTARKHSEKATAWRCRLR